MPFVNKKDMYTSDGKLKANAEVLCLKLSQITLDPYRDWSKRTAKATNSQQTDNKILLKNIARLKEILLENPALITEEKYGENIIGGMLSLDVFESAIVDLLGDKNFAESFKSIENVGFEALDYHSLAVIKALVQDKQFLATHLDNMGRNIPMYMLLLSGKYEEYDKEEYMPIIEETLKRKETRLHRDNLGDNLASIAVDYNNREVLDRCLEYQDLREQNTNPTDIIKRTFVDDAVELGVITQEDVDKYSLQNLTNKQSNKHSKLEVVQ